MAYALHQLGQLIEADIAKRDSRITVFQILVYCFTLTQTGNSTVLPMYRTDIALNALQRIVTAHKCFKAQLQTLIQQLPELLLIAFGNNANLRQVQRNYALIEATFKFIVTVFILPGRQEAAAAHRGENIAFVVFTHLLSADVIGIHTLSAAFYCQTCNVIVLAALQAVMLIQNINQLREGRGYINALVIFNALQTLTQNFFHNHGVFLQIRIILLQIQKQGNKRRLTIGGHQGINLILNSLYAALQLVAQALVCQTLQSFLINVAFSGLHNTLFELFVALTQIFAQMTDINRLTAVLARSNRSNNLCHNGAGNLKALRTFNHFAVHNRAVIQHIADINQAAVENRLNKIVGIMEMQHALFMRLRNLCRQHNTLRQVLGNLTGNQVTLSSSHRCIFITVFFHNVLIAVAD